MTPRRRIIPIFVPHAGCPNNCVFCNQKRISGSLFPACGKTVSDAVLPLEDGAGYELAFYGGSFTAIPAAQQEELLRAAQPALKRGAIRAIRVSTRPDAVGGEALDRLGSYGVETIELGAQSMCDDVLSASGRGHTSADTVRAAGMVKRCGFSLILQMMTGLPGSSEEKDIYTAERLSTLHPHGVRIYPTVVIRDTHLEELWKSGEYKEHTVEDAIRVCSRILPVFEKAGIQVIRLGLNPTEELSGGAAAAGAYHPALGELVRSRILRARMEQLLQKSVPDTSVEILVPERMLSAAIGQHRENVRYLKDRFSLRMLRIRGVTGESDAIELQILP